MPQVVSLGSAIYVLTESALYERDPAQQWQELGRPAESLPTDSALVASDPYVLTIGGRQGGGVVGTVWQYQAIYRTFIPAIPNR